MSQQQTLPPRSGYADMPHAYDPVAQRRLFDGVLGKRFMAFLVDAVIISLLWVVAGIAVFVLGVLTLGLAWLLFGAIFAIVGLGYNAVTIGGPNSATIGQRPMAERLAAWHRSGALFHLRNVQDPRLRAANYGAWAAYALFDGRSAVTEGLAQALSRFAAAGPRHEEGLSDAEILARTGPR